jgi:hypothetical protein
MNRWIRQNVFTMFTAVSLVTIGTLEVGILPDEVITQINTPNTYRLVFRDNSDVTSAIHRG